MAYPNLNHHHNDPDVCLCDDPNEVNNVVVDIAVIAEDLPNISRDTAKTQYLAPIDITYNEFHNLFYFNNGKFTPNIALGCNNQYKHHVTHENKHILHQNGKQKKYNLLEELVEHYQTHLEDPPDCWDPCTRIEFEKKIANIKGLFDVGVCNVTCSLTLDEFFDAIEANGVEMNPHSNMPSLEGQKKKVVALVTTKFISNNHATETDKGVPDLNITWPFRINFSANIKSPQGHGCGDCRKYKQHSHLDYEHEPTDHNCDLLPHTEHQDHEPRTLNDLLDECMKPSILLGNPQVKDYYDHSGNYKSHSSSQISNCLCLKRLHIPNNTTGTNNINSDHLLEHIITPWPCTDWCDGDRYRTSYNMAKWELKCHTPHGEEKKCNDLSASVNVPNTSTDFKWQQICHEDKERCKNVVVNPKYDHKKCYGHCDTHH